MEIKVGDKVRVSKDAPIHIIGSASEIKCKAVVLGTDADIAVIGFRTQEKQRYDAYEIPTKYLIKVEDEVKEPKFKVGDKVRKKKWDKDTTISYVEWHGTWQTYVYRFAEQEYGFNCHKEEDITLVSRRAKEPKFKTGDCVKISFEWNDLPIGEKLVIKRLETIDCRNAYMYSIEGYGGCVIESMLHPYTEPTSPPIKVGDFVRVLENPHEPICLEGDLHLEITNVPPHAVSQKEWKVISVEMRRDCAGRIYTLKHDDSFIYNIPEDCVERVEPKEQTEGKEPKFHIGDIVSYEGISGSMRSGRIISNRNHSNLYGVCSGIDIFHVEEEALNLYNPIKDGYISPIESEPCNTDDTDWDAYAADLAKEIAVKITNKKMDNDPLDVAKYAVSVAKAVVENLKKK